MSLDPAVARAWQAALAAEHQAIFGYDLLGPRLAASDTALARSSQAAHRSTRDAVGTALVAAGLTPVAAQADYPALYPVPGALAARALAVELEDACAAAWRFVFLRAASTAGADVAPAGLPAVAQAQLTASAVRGVRWRVLATPSHATVAFPGL